MADRTSIPLTVQTATPVSAFLKGRAMQMAYESEKLENDFRQMQLEELPKQAEFNRQRQAAEFQLKQEKVQQEQATTRAKGLYGALARASQSDDVLREVNAIAGAMGGQPIQGMAPEQARAEVEKMMRGMEVQYGFEPPVPPKDARPASVKEYEYAKTQGFAGSFMDWEVEQANLKRPVTNVNVTGSGMTPYQEAQIGIANKKLDAAASKQEKADKLAADKERESLTVNMGRLSVLRSEIDDASKLVSNLSAGPGSLTAGIPGVPARNLEAKLNTVKSNLGFDRLDQMRRESPTGGALGQVAVQEINYLQSVVASLDQGQSPEQLSKALKTVDNHYAVLEWAIREKLAGRQDAPRVDNELQYKALPTGSIYVDATDGKKRRKQ
jgi:hypothetical protein